MDQQTIMTVVLLALVGGMLYLSSRSRKRQAANQQAKLNSIVPGVQVMTIAGLQGTVISTADDTVEIEIAPGVRTTWLRTAVRDIIVPPAPEEELVEDADGDEQDSLESYRLQDDNSRKDLN